MSSRKDRKLRKRGRPAHINLNATNSVASTHCDAGLKLALMEEAEGEGLSLSLYVALILAGLASEQRLAASLKAFNAPMKVAAGQ